MPQALIVPPEIVHKKNSVSKGHHKRSISDTASSQFNF
jgi:hypothetical protein